MGFSAVSGLAAISPALLVKERAVPAEVVAGPRSFVTASVRPNPIRADGMIRFGLPSAAVVSLAVYDVQGRAVADLLNGQREEAGEHDVAVRTLGWPPGCCMYRLEAGSVVMTRKMFVVRRTTWSRSFNRPQRGAGLVRAVRQSAKLPAAVLRGTTPACTVTR